MIDTRCAHGIIALLDCPACGRVRDTATTYRVMVAYTHGSNLQVSVAQGLTQSLAMLRMAREMERHGPTRRIWIETE